MTQIFEAYSLELPLEGAVLSGELLVPEQSACGAVFAPAGGLADRDGNDTDVGFSPLRQLAEGLATRGVATLRFDGRGVGGSSGQLASPQRTLDDFLAVLAQAQRLPELGSRLALIGHGVGCTLALVAASRLDNVSGLVLVAPPLSPLPELIGYRTRAAELLADLPPDEHPAALAGLQESYGVRPAFLPPGLKVACPVLAVQGTMDWVFPPTESLRLVGQLGERAERLLIDKLDHWLVPATAWRSPRENLRSDLLLDDGAIDRLAGWLSGLTSA